MNRPAVAASNSMKINGANTQEKNVIEPNSIATDTAPKISNNSGKSIGVRFFYGFATV